MLISLSPLAGLYLPLLISEILLPIIVSVIFFIMFDPVQLMILQLVNTVILCCFRLLISASIFKGKNEKKTIGRKWRYLPSRNIY